MGRLLKLQCGGYSPGSWSLDCSAAVSWLYSSWKVPSGSGDSVEVLICWLNASGRWLARVPAAGRISCNVWGLLPVRSRPLHARRQTSGCALYFSGGAEVISHTSSCCRADNAQPYISHIPSILWPFGIWPPSQVATR